MENQNSGGLLTVSRGEFDASILALEKAGLKPWMLKLLRQQCGEEIAKKIVSIFIDIKIKDWQEFYKKYFNIRINSSSVNIPNSKVKFDRLMIIPKELTILNVYRAMSHEFNCYWDNSVDDEVSSNLSSLKYDSYAFWVKDGIESDKKYLGKFDDDNKEINFSVETLREALIHHFKYWSETGKHINQATNLLTKHHLFQGLISVNYRGSKLFIQEFKGFARPQFCGPRESIG